MKLLTKEELPLGTRVMLARDVERFPNFIAHKGMTGTVVQHGGYCVCVRMDLHLDGAEDWDNEIEWAREDDRILDFEDDTHRLIELNATFPIVVQSGI